MAAPATEPPPPGPSARSRRRTNIFIAGFIAIQFLVPLTYLVREDASDDRFTWRRFSESTAPVCQTTISAFRFDGSENDLQLRRLVHEDWVRYVQQGRRAVVDAVLLEQCRVDGVERVELVNRCTDERETRRYALRCGGERARETTRTAAR